MPYIRKIDPKARRHAAFMNAAILFLFAGFLVFAYEAYHWFRIGEWVTVPVSFPLQSIPGLVPAIDAWIAEPGSKEWLASKLDQWLMAPLSWALAAIGCLVFWVASMVRPRDDEQGS
jgi:hypothetical protein